MKIQWIHLHFCLFSAINIFVIVCDGSSSTASPIVPSVCVPDNTHIDEWSKNDFPNPQIHIDRCGRNCKKSWICDPGHILTSSGADRLDSQIEAVKTIGTCPCRQCGRTDGYNISIALVPGMSLYSWEDATEAARRFAEYLRDEWNFQRCANDIVIFISRDDRKVYTMAGKTAYKFVTLDCIEAVYNKVRPTLKTGRYQTALETMVSDYRSVLEKESCEHLIEDEEMSEGTLVAIVLCSVFGGVGFLGCCCFCCIKCGCCSGGGGSGRSYWSSDHYCGGGGGGGGGGGFFSGWSSGGGGGGGGGDF